MSKLKVDTISNNSGGTPDISGIGNPVGTVIMYYGAVPPSGYLECDGQSTSGYIELENLIGANVPDLRGEFVRGWDNGKGKDTGRSLGSTQDATEVGYRVGTPLGGYSGTAYAGFRYQADRDTAKNIEPTSTQDTTTTADATGGSTQNSRLFFGAVRPSNVSLMYCIKH